MEKSAEAFRTISEVADELKVPKHVLRFWEGKFTQIKPMKRGGGRRYYRPDDVEFLRGIRRLLHDEGYTIKGVQKVIKQSGVEFVKQGSRQSEATALPEQAAAMRTPARPATESGTQVGPSKRAVTLLRRALRDLEACQDILEAGG
jgi:DNA-binding transcriptional MerR regulator